MSRGEPLIRQWNLLKTLQKHRFGVGIDELAREMECSKRQVQRDLAVLVQVGFPVSHETRDFGKRFWRMPSEFIQRDGLMLNLTEMLSLFLSRQVLAPLTGTQYGDGLATALDKIKAVLAPQALAHFEDLDENLLVKQVGQQDYSGHDKQIAIINQAMNDGRVLRIRYRSASKGRELTTRFHPYGLVFFGMNLYCIGHLEEYDEVRTLKVLRLLGVEMTAETFEKPPTFSLKAYTRGAFGVFHGSVFGTVKIRFTGWAATNVREQKWHASQQIIKDSRGGGNGPRRRAGEDCVIATFELAETTEFKRWLLGFGRYAVVMSPRKLAAELKAEFRQACGAYGVRCRGSTM
jgi:predicted DNA-binding transcriptional regulator YafY